MNTGGGKSNIILQKLDEFIRKYYKNQLIKGLLWGLGGVLSAFIMASALEYFGQFGTGTRQVLFYLWAGFSVFVLIRYVAIPLGHLYRIGQVIDHQTAARIVGDHFPEIQDKLLNTLQLEKQKLVQDDFLLEASIKQRTLELSPVPFSKAIDLRQNLRYLKFVLIPVVLLAFILLVAPGFTDSTKRLVNFNTHYAKKAPFTFVLLNEDLQAVQNEDFEIHLEINGAALPKEVYIELDGHRFKMRDESPGVHSFLIRNPQKNLPFLFNAEGFSSGAYTLNVVPKPMMLHFEAQIEYPPYTGRKNEILKNIGDLSVPAGTRITWNFNTRNVERMDISFGDEKSLAIRKDKDHYQIQKRFLTSESVLLSTSNQQMPSADSIRYQINVIPDAYPQIQAKQQNDTLSAKIIYFIGDINDDYGFNRLTFNYRFTESPEAAKKATPLKSIPIKIDRDHKSQTFYYYWDLNELQIKSADKVEYFFEVWDNDAVHGSKASRTLSGVFAAPTTKEIELATEQKNKEIKADLNQSLKEAKKLDQEIKKIQERLTEKKNLSWEDKKKVEEMLEKHEDLEEKLRNLVEENKKKNFKENEFKDIDKEMLDKQQELEKLFNEVVNDELKELMDKIRDLMEKNNKEQLQQELEKFKLNDKELMKQMDRMLELFKELELEKKLKETISKLDKLAEDQKKLADETEKNKSPNEALQKKQEALNKEFDDLKKDLKDIDKKNQDLDKPKDLDKTDQEQKSIEKEMKDGSEDLKEQENKKAGQHQKKAAEQMKELSDKMEKMMQKAKKKQHVEDYNTLREILENLVQVSYDQEHLMQEFKGTREYNPRYVELGQLQKKIKDDTRMIEDSLLALSKRVVEVQSFINKEIGLINSHIDKSITHLGERQTHQVINNQQYVMTSLNNLALMLSDVLKQMQEQMKNEQPGSGNCQNPGGKNPQPSFNMLKDMQDGLSKKMEQLMKGQQNGQGKPGSKEFAEMAAQQAAIRKKLRDLQQKLDKEGQGGKMGNLQKTQEMMDQLERDLVNKRMNPDTWRRQQEILHRLLEHEKAEKEQEQEERRTAKEGRDIKRDMPPALQEYLRQREREQELLKTMPPDLSPYYKDRVRDYFKQIGTQ